MILECSFGSNTGDATEATSCVIYQGSFSHLRSLYEALRAHIRLMGEQLYSQRSHNVVAEAAVKGSFTDEQLEKR